MQRAEIIKFVWTCLFKEIGENANEKAEMGMLITYYREIKIGIKVIFFEY